MNREQTLALYKQGREVWNEWAKEMLAEKKKLIEAGEWGMKKDAIDDLVPKNEATKDWFVTARADFSGAIFHTDADFVGFIFPNEAWFESVMVKGEGGELHQQPVIFKKNARFGGATFGGDARFNEATFGGNARFGGAMFGGDARFNEATFGGDARFNEATFGGNARFNGATFGRNAWFYKATFGGDAWFEKATFDGVAWLNEATFGGNVRFSEAAFGGNAWFNEATFGGDARFNKATFGGGARFGGATFGGDARFEKAQFSGDARFEKAQFSGDAWFTTAHFIGYTVFRQTEFRKVAAFDAISVDSAFSLEGAIFHKLPDFRQAHFIEAPGLDSLILTKTVEPGGLVKSIVRRVKPDVSSKYRALKALAILGHDHEQKQIFFRGEMRARRGNADRGWHWRYWLGLFYEIFSDFGRSIFRPLLGWALTVAGFAWFYLFWHNNAAALTGKTVGNCFAGSGTPWVSALYLSLKKSLLSLGWEQSEKINQTYACLYGVNTSYKAGVRGGELVPIIPDMVSFMAIPQSLLSAVLLFLFALAVRNAFRI